MAATATLATLETSVIKPVSARAFTALNRGHFLNPKCSLSYIPIIHF